MVSYIPGGAGFLPSTVLLIARFPYNTMYCKWHNVSLWCQHFLTTMLDRQHHPAFDVLVKSHEEYSCTQLSPHIVVVPFHPSHFHPSHKNRSRIALILLNLFKHLFSCTDVDFCCFLSTISFLFFQRDSFPFLGGHGRWWHEHHERSQASWVHSTFGECCKIFVVCRWFFPLGIKINAFSHFEDCRLWLFSSQFDLHIFGKAILCVYISRKGTDFPAEYVSLWFFTPWLARSGSTCLPHSEPCESWKATGESEPKTIACLESWECRHVRRCYLTPSMVDNSCFF